MGAAEQVRETLIVWRAQPGPQRALLRCPVFEVFFGGARGGGKSDAMLGEWTQHAGRHGKAANGVFFRRELTQLDEVIARSIELYSRLGAEWKDQKKTWLFPNGARLKFRPLERDRDAEKYQGHSYTRVYAEELGNFPNPQPILKMMATLRSADGVPCRFRGTGNPGGPGHNWLKRRYIDPAPPFEPFPDPHTGLLRVFIPARLKDNLALVANDPQYADRLRQSGPREIVRAWLEGDWNIVAGGMFDDLWSEAAHVVRPFTVPSSWRIDRAFDWGSARPFSVGWWAESDGSDILLADGDRRSTARGDLFRIAEWYGSTGEPNEGLRLTDARIADGIVERERALGIHGRVRPGPADTQIFDRDAGGASIAEAMNAKGVRWLPADKTPGSRKRGWQAVRRRLEAAATHPREEPGLFVFETCRACIAQLPTAPRSERDPEDVDTASEDHILDELRYRCLASRREATALRAVGGY